jgi:phosphoserine aminotransferase
MTERIFNFSAGPAVLPVPVLEEAQRDMLSLPGVGMSVMEISHRSKTFDAIIGHAEAGLRELLKVPDNYHILFLQGGASLQFSMVPMNFLPADGSADYVLTGSWGKKALKEAKKVGAVSVAATMADGGFTRVPSRDEMSLNPHAAYVHITSNETIEGVQWKREPNVGDVPMVADMSSDILSRAIDVSKYALIYAGAQKNIGPAGLTVVIVRNDLLGRARRECPSVLDYAVQANAGSMYNTPPTFGIYLAGLTFEWLAAQGGLAGIERQNVAKASALYAEIDRTGFYRNDVQPADRSRMSVPFFLRDERLNAPFLAGAEERGLMQLKGHRAVGGMRASIYNAMPLDGVLKLVDWMREFEREHG